MNLDKSVSGTALIVLPNRSLTVEENAHEVLAQLKEYRKV